MAQDWSIPVARLGEAVLFVCPIGPACPILPGQVIAWLPDDDPAHPDRSRQAGGAPAHVRDRKAQSRAFLRAILAAELGVGPAEVHLTATPRGKPFLAGPGPNFNASHAHEHAVVALSARRAVGVDIEEPKRLPQDPEAFDALVDACCHPSEAAAVRSAASPQLTFLRFWVAKEARMKLTGEGLSLGPMDIRLADDRGRPTGYALPATPSVDLALLEDLLPAAAVAVASGHGDLHLLA